MHGWKLRGEGETGGNARVGGTRSRDAEELMAKAGKGR